MTRAIKRRGGRGQEFRERRPSSCQTSLLPYSWCELGCEMQVTDESACEGHRLIASSTPGDSCTFRYSTEACKKNLRTCSGHAAAERGLRDKPSVGGGPRSGLPTVF